MTPLDHSLTRKNNFDFMRFLLASLVLFSHCFVLLRGNEGGEPLMRLSRGQLTLGSVAVNGFFVISGFLVAQSWARSSGLLDFAKKRVLRIYPGYALAILFCAFVASPLGSDGSASVFSAGPLAKIVPKIIVLSGYDPPQVFASNPVPHLTNGSLWTIRYEFLCYFVLAALALAGCLRRRLPLLGLLIAAHVAYSIPSLLGNRVAWDHVLPHLLGRLSLWPRFLTYFLMGVVFCRYHERIRYTWWAALVALGAVIVAVAIPNGLKLLLPLFGSYLLFWFAFNPAIPLARFGRWGDFSYGIYLYAFPIQQLLVQRLDTSMHPCVFFLVAMPCALVAGVLSWHLVEKRFLRLKYRRKRPEAAGAALEQAEIGATV